MSAAPSNPFAPGSLYEGLEEYASPLEVGVASALGPVAFSVQWLLVAACLSQLWRQLRAATLLRDVALTVYICALSGLNSAFIGKAALVTQCVLVGALMVGVFSSLELQSTF